MASLLKRERSAGGQLTSPRNRRSSPAAICWSRFATRPLFTSPLWTNRSNAPAPFNRLDRERSSYDDAWNAEFNHPNWAKQLGCALDPKLRFRVARCHMAATSVTNPRACPGLLSIPAAKVAKKGGFVSRRGTRGKYVPV